MRKNSSAKNLFEPKRIQKKNEKHPEKPNAKERRSSLDELRNKLKEIRINLDEHDEITRLYNIEKNTNKLLHEFGGMKDTMNTMNDTMDTMLLITLSKDTNCPFNQRIKLNKILKKKRENIIRRYTNPNQNNVSHNQVNPKIPINRTPVNKIKINSSFKNDNPSFANKYEHRKYSTAINNNKTNNAGKINLRKKLNISDSSRDDFSSKKSDSKYSNNLSIKPKSDSMGAIAGGFGFSHLNTKKIRNNDSLNPFRTNIYEKEDKKQQQKNCAKPSNINKTFINKRKNDSKKKNKNKTYPGIER